MKHPLFITTTALSVKIPTGLRLRKLSSKERIRQNDWMTSTNNPPGMGFVSTFDFFIDRRPADLPTLSFYREVKKPSANTLNPPQDA